MNRTKDFLEGCRMPHWKTAKVQGPMHFREGLLPGNVSVLPGRAASREKPGLHPARPVFYWSKSAGQLSWGPSGACLNPIQVP